MKNPPQKQKKLHWSELLTCPPIVRIEKRSWCLSEGTKKRITSGRRPGLSAGFFRLPVLLKEKWTKPAVFRGFLFDSWPFEDFGWKTPSIPMHFGAAVVSPKSSPRGTAYKVKKLGTCQLLTCSTTEVGAFGMSRLSGFSLFWQPRTVKPIKGQPLSNGSI